MLHHALRVAGGVISMIVLAGCTVAATPDPSPASSVPSALPSLPTSAPASDQEQDRAAAASAFVVATNAFEAQAATLDAAHRQAPSLSSRATLCTGLVGAFETLRAALAAITYPADARELADRLESYYPSVQLNLKACATINDDTLSRRAWDLAWQEAGKADEIANLLRTKLGLSPGTTAALPPLPTLGPTPSPTPRATVPPPTTAPSHVVSLAEKQLRGSRQPILDALARLGHQCGPEQTHPNDLPTIACTFPGARPSEGVLMIAAANDFRGVGAFSYDRARLAAFLVAVGSQEISDDLVRGIDGILAVAAMPNSLCPLPCDMTTSGAGYGKLEGRARVEPDMLMTVILQEFGF